VLTVRAARIYMHSFIRALRVFTEWRIGVVQIFRTGSRDIAVHIFSAKFMLLKRKQPSPNTLTTDDFANPGAEVRRILYDPKDPELARLSGS
jgi:hypothetical protein